MAKKKEDLDKKRDEFLNQARDVLKDLKDCDFEEFKEQMIVLGEQLLAANFMIMEWVGEERNKIFDMAVDEVKKIRATNDKDFKIAEKNFKKMGKLISDCEKHNAIAEATSMVSLMYTCAGLNAMGKRTLITDITLNEGLKLIPKKVKKHITKTLEMEPKRFDKLLEEALEATA